MTTLRLLLAAALLGVVAACQTPGKSGDAGRALDPAPSFAPTWVEVRAAQERRLDALLPFHAAGQIELRWTDRDGAHFEYCRGEVFVRAPSDAALSLTKVGERFLWLGESGNRRFLFDLRTKAPVLWLVGGLESRPPRPARTPDSGDSPDSRDSAPLVAQQASIFDLLGLMPFPPAEDLDAVLEGDARTLRVEFAGVGGPIRVTIDVPSLLPTRIEQLDAQGGLLLTSVFSEYESVDRDEMAPGALPKFPSRVVVTTAAFESDDSPTEPQPIPASKRSGADQKPAAPKEEIRLFLGPTKDGVERIRDRLFDLEALIETFKPVRIEER